MQQRQLRLGDILDDYCPRERRLSNHTIVAMVGDDIRLTRCTTCDTEHAYKGGKAPRLRRKKTTVEAAYDEVLDSVKHDPPQGVLVAHQPPAPAEPETPDAEQEQAAPDGGSNGDAPSHADPSAHGAGGHDAPDEVRLHRPLIRAQLPRLEKEPTPRPVPEFTIRQANKRQGRFQNNSRPGRFAKAGHGGGPRSGGGNQPGRPQGQGSSRPGARHRNQQHNKKRSR